MNFEIGERVFYPIDPDFTVNFEPAIECWVESVIVEKTESGENIKGYRISFHTFDPPQIVEPGELYKNENNAINAVRTIIENKIKGLEDRLKKYKEVLEGLK